MHRIGNRKIHKRSKTNHLNCNLADYDNFAKLTKGLQKSKTIEFIDFQCCDLSDKHSKSICAVIKE